MTDLVAQLRAVEEAAEKARTMAAAARARKGVRQTELNLADAVDAFTDLPFRAVREELEALRATLTFIAEASESWHGDDAAKGRALGVISSRARAVLLLSQSRARAVLCPDPAGGER